MGLRLPFSKKKRYLTGIDWIINMLDRMLKDISAAGNAFQIILKLDSALSNEAFRETFSEFSTAFPVLRGRVRRDFNLAPYWHVPGDTAGRPLDIASHELPADMSDTEVWSRIGLDTNIPFPDSRTHIAFTLYRRHDNESYLAARFDHRLFDARGAEAFLSLFQEFCSGKPLADLSAGISLHEPAHLDNWLKKFKSGQQANRAILSLSENSQSIFDFASIKDNTTHFRVIEFTERESAQIMNAAREQAGFLMLTPYLLGRSIQALHRTLAARNMAPPAYVIPVSLDMRPLRSLRERLFFNHVSFMFLSADAQLIPDEPALIAALLEQIYEQTKSGLREHLQEASMLMRILPARALARLARLPLRGECGALSFSQLSEPALESDELLGARILNIVHTPRVPIPPGIGFFFSRYKGRLNASLSYIDSLLSKSDVDMIEDQLRREHTEE